MRQSLLKFYPYINVSSKTISIKITQFAAIEKSIVMLSNVLIAVFSTEKSGEDPYKRIQPAYFLKFHKQIILKICELILLFKLIKFKIKIA